MSFAVRPDAALKLRGLAEYGMDLSAPGMLWAALVPSPVDRGRLRSVDLAPARSIPGVVAIGPEDLGRLVSLKDADADRPIFPLEQIQYRHQPLAAVCAPDLSTARRAARAVRLQIDPMPAPDTIDDDGVPSASDPSVIAHVHSRHGDVEAAFESADVVFSETYRTAGVCQVALEPHACLAEIRDGEIWHVRTSTQTPFGVREDTASLLGLPEQRLVVDGTWVGGGFGGKGAALLEPYALLLAKASGRPVRLALSYREEFLLGHSSLPSFVRISSAVRNGILSGRRVLWKLDAGASLPGRDFVIGYCIVFLPGPYRVPAIEMEGFAMRSHKPPLGAHRAPMAPQCAFVAESHMDHLAMKLGVDSVAFRRAQAWQAGDSTHLGQTVGPFGLVTCLEKAEALAARWRAEMPRGHGVGVGAGFWSTGTGAGGEARLLLGPDRLAIEQGEREIGSGSVLRGIAAVAERVTGLDRASVRVDYLPTSHAPFDSGVFGSRTVGALGQAVEKAALTLLDELAQRIGAPGERIRLEVSAGAIHAVAGSVRRPVRELFTASEAASGGIRADGKHYGASGTIDTARVVEGTFYAYGDFTAAAHVAEVAVDSETGAVRAVRYAAFHDAGTVVDAATARASVEGGIAMGLGTALTEESMWEPDGVFANPHLLDYRVPTLTEIPPIEVIFVEGFPGGGPFGAKGLGEPPIIPVPATISNAIRDATGAAMTELPMTGERVARALKLL